MAQRKERIKMIEKFKVGEAYVLLFLCGLGDALTTLAGLSLGLTETRIFFFPFLATAIFTVAVRFINRLPGPETAKDVISTILVLMAFSGVAYNLAGLSGIRSLSLLG
jgi:hypothetical protein